jgi:hypothetical protein
MAYMTHPIFEESTSPLTTSNDGLLYHRKDYGESVHILTYDPTGEIVLATYSREIADAFIAGYDRDFVPKRSPLAKQLVDGHAA